MAYSTLDEIFLHAKSKKGKRLAVAAAHDLETLKAVIKAKVEGVIEPILVGDAEQIKVFLSELNQNPYEYQIVAADDDDDAARKAVALVKEDKADFLMKGLLNTASLLRAVVNKENGLGTGGTISHINLMQIEGYHKLLIITDVGMVIEPTLAQKKDIVENAVAVFRNMGYDKPKVAVLAAVETVNPKMPETVDAAELQKMSETGEIQHAIVEGPISFDIALNQSIAKTKGYTGVVPGDPDILVVPNVVSGNIMVKGISQFAKGASVAFVTGAKVPIVLTSRGTPSEGKYDSILTCVATL